LTVFLLTVRIAFSTPLTLRKWLAMLTDVAIKKLKTKDKIYKVADRDGMYVAVSPSGQITFRYDYRVNGRRETLTIGRYGLDGIFFRFGRAAG
jgi:hypothetical protein